MKKNGARLIQHVAQGFRLFISSNLFNATMVLGGMRLMDVWFAPLLRVCFMPAIAASYVFSSLSYWYNAYQQKDTWSLVQAVAYTLFAAATFAAAIGMLVSVTVFAFVGPILLAAAMLSNAIFSLCSGIYNVFKATQTDSVAIKTEFKHKAIESFVEAFTCTVAAAALAVLMIFTGPTTQLVVCGVALLLNIAAFIIPGIIKKEHHKPVSLVEADAVECRESDLRIDEPRRRKTSDATVVATLMSVGEVESQGRQREVQLEDQIEEQREERREERQEERQEVSRDDALDYFSYQGPNGI